jgi:hypothetical protein
MVWLAFVRAGRAYRLRDNHASRVLGLAACGASRRITLRVLRYARAVSVVLLLRSVVWCLLPSFGFVVCFLCVLLFVLLCYHIEININIYQILT